MAHVSVQCSLCATFSAYIPLTAARSSFFAMANFYRAKTSMTCFSLPTNGLANVSSHSLRIGAASTAAAMGCPKWLIQAMGRWTSDCFRRYIRINDTTIRRTSRILANCRITVPTDFNPLIQ